MGQLLKLKNVRISFAEGLFTAKPPKNGTGDPKFSVSFLFEKDSDQEKAVKAAINAVAVEKWKDKAPAVLKGIKAKDGLCLHDGDLKPEYEGYEGSMFLSANSKKKPKARGLDGKRDILQSDGVIYSGCYGTALVEVWAQDNVWGTRVNAELKGFQFTGDGDSFSAGSAPVGDDQFDDLADTGEVDGLLD